MALSVNFLNLILIFYVRQNKNLIYRFCFSILSGDFSSQPLL
nr:MAG TPA: hypothetical protein [Caudoviricetes sp.]DAW73473.1 MAG TPA: hypothetical protein [Caudoviricetes sp.]